MTYDARFFQFRDRSFSEATVPVGPDGRPLGVVSQAVPDFPTAVDLLVNAQGYTAP